MIVCSVAAVCAGGTSASHASTVRGEPWQVLEAAGADSLWVAPARRVPDCRTVRVRVLAASVSGVRITVTSRLDDPGSECVDSGELSAPVRRKVRLGVPLRGQRISGPRLRRPVFTLENWQQWHASSEAVAPGRAPAPNLVGLSVRRATTIVKTLGVAQPLAVVDGPVSGWIAAQEPAAGSGLDLDQAVLRVSTQSKRAASGARVTVRPNLALH